MSEWTKVVTQPLGLVGFALSLVFTYLGKIKIGDERRWLAPAAFASAAVVLVGGLAIAYIQVPKTTTPSPITTSQPAIRRQDNQQVQQTTSGPGSPVIQGVQGNVTITEDLGSGTNKVQQPPQTKPKQENK
jgi:hypothetical protein